MSDADTLRRLAALEKALGEVKTHSRPNQNTSTGSSPTFVDVVATGSFDIANNEMRGYEDLALTNGSIMTFTNRRGLLLVSNVTNNIVELLLVTANGTAVSIGGNGLTCTLNADAGTTFAVLTSGGTFVLKNRYGATKSVRVQLLGN